MAIQLNGARITWLGHASFKITTPSQKTILIDPWLEGNPSTPAEAKKQDHVDIILVTHAHGDHIGDVISLAKTHHPQVVAIVELGGWFASKGVENVIAMNKGGTISIEGIKVSMTHAIHSSGISDNDQIIYGGEPAGYVIELENGLKIYHAGDTIPFMDMQLIQELYTPDLALLPIGDFYTMAPRGAAIAMRLLGIKHVIPMHFGTFPILSGTPGALREELLALGLNDVEVIEMQPGQTLS